MADEGFPTINYVPIPQGGGNILEGLMQLYGAYKGYKSQKQSDDYLAGHPYNGATNSGALDAALKVGGGQETAARTSNLGADSGYREALTKFLPQDYSIKQEDADSNSSRATSDAANAVTEGRRVDLSEKTFDAEQNPMSPANNRATQEEMSNENNQLAQRKEESARTALMSQDAQARTQESGVQHQDAVKALQMDHYSKLLEYVHDNPGAENDPAIQAQMQASRASIGIPEPSAPKAAGAGVGAVPLPGDTSQPNGQPAASTRLSQTMHDLFSSKMSKDSFDPMNRVMNTATNAYNTVNPTVDAQGQPVGAATKHLPGVGDIPADIVDKIQQLYAPKKKTSNTKGH